MEVPRSPRSHLHDVGNTSSKRVVEGIIERYYTTIWVLLVGISNSLVINLIKSFISIIFSSIISLKL